MPKCNLGKVKHEIMLVSSFPSKGWYVGWPGVAFRGPCVYRSALDVKSFSYVSRYWAVFIAHLLLMGLKWKCTIWCSIVILNPTFLNLIFSQRQPHYYTLFLDIILKNAEQDESSVLLFYYNDQT